MFAADDVPGIGPIISSAMVAAIGTGEVFSKGRDFGAWLGLVPKQISTGDRTILGKISRRGNRYLRVLFVQAAWVVLVKIKNWERYGLKSWIEAAKRRLHHNVLAIALANKLARIAWACWLKDAPSRRGRAVASTRLIRAELPLPAGSAKARRLATSEPAASQGPNGRLSLPPLRATRSTLCGPGRRNGPWLEQRNSRYEEQAMT